jgi:hypothetical protein
MQMKTIKPLKNTFCQGAFAIFGDDAIFQNKFLNGGNLFLGRNLARWFCSSTPSKKLI